MVGRVAGRRGIAVGMEEGEVRKKGLVQQVVVGQLHLHVLGVGDAEARMWGSLGTR